MRVAAFSLLAAALFAVPVGTARTPAMFRVIATAPTWSPDGESVAYTQQLPGDRSKLVLASLRDGSRRNLASDGYAPQFSPTGSLVAYIGREPTSGNLDERTPATDVQSLQARRRFHLRTESCSPTSAR